MVSAESILRKISRVLTSEHCINASETRVSIGSDYGLSPIRRQAIIQFQLDPVEQDF